MSGVPLNLNECLEVAKGNLKQLRLDFAEAQRVNDDLLMQVLKDNAQTELGRELGFDAIRTVAEFKATVPFSNYGTYERRIRRMLAGEEGLMTSYPLLHYAKTSGSVGVPKSIPLSKKAFATYLAYDMPMALAVFDEWAEEHGGYFDTDGEIVTLVVTKLEGLECGLSTGAISSGMYSNMKDSLGTNWAIPDFCVYSEGETADWLFLKALFALRNSNVTCIDGIFSTAVFDFFFYIRRNAQTLVEAIRSGIIPDDIEMTDRVRKQAQAELTADPGRANELTAIFEEGFGTPIARRIWPKLQFIICICTAAFAPYAEKLKTYIGDIPIYGRAYAASEALMATSLHMNDDGHYLIPSGAYFEFIPAEDAFLPEEQLRERTLGISELEAGHDYEVIVTNLSGFYRYRIGDVITVLGYDGQSPKICFKYRLSQIISMAGEKTSMACIDDAIAKLERTQGIPVPDFSIYADYETEPGRYVLLMEPGLPIPRADMPDIAGYLEKRLEENNPSYKNKVNDGILLPLAIGFVQPDTYRLYREVQLFKGASDNQLKPVRMIDNPAKERFFFGLVEKEL